MNPILHWGGWLLLALIAVAAVIVIWIYWRGTRHEQLMLQLLDGADALEARIKQCRAQLGQAHAAVKVVPGMPSAGSADAREAVDNALRDLLQHRLWLRDVAPRASYAELRRATEALDKANAQVEAQLAHLENARKALDNAVHKLESTQ